MDPQLIENLHAVVVPVTQVSGINRYLEFCGRPFVVAEYACKHPAAEVALYLTGKDLPADLSAVLVCDVCGVHYTQAMQQFTPAEMVIRNERTEAIFGWSNDQFSRRPGPAWGRSSKRGNEHGL